MTYNLEIGNLPSMAGTSRAYFTCIDQYMALASVATELLFSTGA